MNTDPAGPQPAPDADQSITEEQSDQADAGSAAALILFDFSESLLSSDENARRRGVYALLELLLDPVACGGRIALLRSVQFSDSAEPLRRAAVTSVPSERLDQCVEWLCRVGVFSALEQQRVTVDDLVALSISPTHLWQAHQQLCQLMLDADVDDAD